MTIQMSTAGLWLLVAVIGVGTFALRVSFIHLWGRIYLPEIVRRALRFIPAAVLAALVAPALLRPHGPLDLSLHNLRLIAGLAAAGVALLSRNVLLTLGVGMGVLWLFRALTGAG